MRQRTRVQRTLVMLNQTDLQRLAALFGDLDGTAEILIIPWEVATAAGWQYAPDTVLVLQERMSAVPFAEASKIRIIRDPSFPILGGPEQPITPKVWKPDAQQKIKQGPVSLKDLLPPGAME